jgi:outer membrane lipoprotein-sorting protein
MATPKLFLVTMTTALMVISSAVHAQQLPPTSAPAPSSPATAPVAPVPLTIPTKQDLKLLSKAAGLFWQTDRSETESKTWFYGTRDGVKVNSTIDVQTIVQTGGKFRSQLTFTPIGSTQKTTYLLVSDGGYVWIYRKDRNEYTKTTVAVFNNERNWIGISSFLFLSLDEANRQGLIASLGTDQDIIMNLNQPKPEDLQFANRQIDGVNLSVYSFNVNQFKVDVFLRPETAKLLKIEFISQEPGLDLKFSETIIKRSSQVNITDRTFTFTPPKGTKKVKFVKIAL